MAMKLTTNRPNSDPENAVRRLTQHPHAVGFLFILGMMPAMSEELASNRLRVCISRALPEK